MSFTEKTAHDLWIEARQFSISTSRPTPTSIQIDVTRPASMEVVDGAVIVLSATPAGPEKYPVDGTQYAPSLVWGTGDQIGDSQVIAFYSAANALPLPAGTTSADGTTISWSLTVTGTTQGTTYYASVHAASDVLSYYPLGIQSYPIDVGDAPTPVSSYTGSIPRLPSAPTSPTAGMVYFDQQLNLVQYWDATRSLWIPTRTDTILSGDTNPGLAGQAYLLRGNILKIFDGQTWVAADSTNLSFFAAGSWIPFTKISGLVAFPTAPAAGDVLYNYTEQRVVYFDGVQWQTPTPSTALFLVNGNMIPAFTAPFTVQAEDLITPYAGLLFYNTNSHQLLAWNGSAWGQVNTAQVGEAISDKVGIGNDGNYAARLTLINILKGQLGWPGACVELAEEQFNIAIDNALDTYRQLSIGAYEQRFIIYQLIRDQSTYFLNSPVDRTDSVVSVMKVHRLNMMGVQGAGPDNTWGMAFSQQFTSITAGGTALLDTHMLYQWSEEFSKIFAGDIPFVWNEARRELFLKRAIRQNEKIVLEVELERSEQELMSDRWCKQFIQNWALAECKEYLGMIRSKYSSGTPGASGTITMNGETLLSEARQDFDELKESLLNYEYQNAEHGNVAFLLA